MLLTIFCRIRKFGLNCKNADFDEFENCHLHRDVTNTNFYESTIFQSRSIHSIIGFLLLTQAVGVGCATLNLTEYYKNYCYFYLKIWFFSIVCIPMMAMQILYSYRVYYQLGHYARISMFYHNICINFADFYATILKFAKSASI